MLGEGPCALSGQASRGPSLSQSQPTSQPGASLTIGRSLCGPRFAGQDSRAGTGEENSTRSDLAVQMLCRWASGCSYAMLMVSVFQLETKHLDCYFVK